MARDETRLRAAQVATQQEPGSADANPAEDEPNAPSTAPARHAFHRPAAPQPAKSIKTRWGCVAAGRALTPEGLRQRPYQSTFRRRPSPPGPLLRVRCRCGAQTRQVSLLPPGMAPWAISRSFTARLCHCLGRFLLNTVDDVGRGCLPLPAGQTRNWLHALRVATACSTDGHI